MAAYIEDGHAFLIRYVRKADLAPYQSSKKRRAEWEGDRTPVGCVAVTRVETKTSPVSGWVTDDQHIVLGWSLCRRTSGWKPDVFEEIKPDVFSKERARTIAIQRALSGSRVELPRSIAQTGLHWAMMERAEQYFNNPKKEECS